MGKKPAAASKTSKKRVSKVAKGKRAKAQVFAGRKEKTVGALTKRDLMKNKAGKIVSRKASAAAKARYQGSRLQAWTAAVRAARKALGVTGFCAVNGNTAVGKALYVKAKAILSAS